MSSDSQQCDWLITLSESLFTTGPQEVMDGINIEQTIQPLSYITTLILKDLSGEVSF